MNVTVNPGIISMSHLGGGCADSRHEETGVVETADHGRGGLAKATNI